MPLAVPNLADAAFAAQADLDSRDVEILGAGFTRTGVVSGCAVTAQGTPDMTLAVAAGIVEVAGRTATVAAGNVTITTAHATHPRFDLVVADDTGAKSVVAGTAAATPVFPAIPASSAVFVAVYIPANDTAINSNQITDKRVTLWVPSSIVAVSVADVTVVNTTAETDLVSLTLPGGSVVAGELVRLTADFSLFNNSGSSVNFTLRLKFGATTVLAAAAQSIGTGANRYPRSLVVNLAIESTTAQRINAFVLGAGSTAAGVWSSIPTGHSLEGRASTAENTATAKALKLTLQMGTASTLAEGVAHAAALEVVSRR